MLPILLKFLLANTSSTFVSPRVISYISMSSKLCSTCQSILLCFWTGTRVPPELEVPLQLPKDLKSAAADGCQLCSFFLQGLRHRSCEPYPSISADLSIMHLLHHDDSNSETSISRWMLATAQRKTVAYLTILPIPQPWCA
jgi:hypothetical protein